MRFDICPECKSENIDAGCGEGVDTNDGIENPELPCYCEDCECEFAIVYEAIYHKVYKVEFKDCRLNSTGE